MVTDKRGLGEGRDSAGRFPTQLARSQWCQQDPAQELVGRVPQQRVLCKL